MELSEDDDDHNDDDDVRSYLTLITLKSQQTKEQRGFSNQKTL